MNKLEGEVFKKELEKHMDSFGYQVGSFLGELLANEIIKENRARELKDRLDINDNDMENKGRKKV